MEHLSLLDTVSSVRNRYQKTAATFAAMACMLLLLPATGGAATVLTSGDDLAYRIENLDVGGTLYNVDFVWTTAEDIYGSPPNPVFDFPGESSATDARGAVLAALNAYNAALDPGQTLVELVGPQDRSQESTFFRIGFQSENLGTTIRNITGSYQNLPFPGWADDVGTFIVASGAVESWADFTEVSAVPVPAAVWLFGSGLLGLIGIARKKLTV